MNRKNLNLPNFLTILRILLTPVLIFCLFQKSLLFYILSLVIFIVASITDFFDGYLARKWKEETDFGKFLDPFADKIIVVSCFIAFLFLQKQVEVWMVFIIIGRDIMITALRYFAISKNTVMQTNLFGKVKTVIQMVVIIVLFLFLIITPESMRLEINHLYEIEKLKGLSGLEVSFHQSTLLLDSFKKQTFQLEKFIYLISSFLPYFFIFIATFVTFLSGLVYLLDNRKLFFTNK